MRKRKVDGKPMSMRAIAEALGVSAATVNRYLDPKVAEKARDTAREYQRAKRAKGDYGKQGRCRKCGKPMGKGVRDDGICRPCRNAGKREREATIKRMLAAGEPHRVIAGHLGITEGALGVAVYRMRSAGLL